MDASHKSGGAAKTSAASGQVLAMRPQGLAYNAAKDDGFACSACDHTVPFTSETEWSRVSLHDGRTVFTEGAEPSRFCPHCGSSVVTLQQYLALMSA